MEETSRYGIWDDINLGIREGLMFYQTRSNAIILQGTLPVHWIVRAERLKNGEKLYERQYLSPRPPPKIVLRMISIGQKGIMNWALQLNIDQLGNSFKQSLGETVHLDSPKPTQSPKTNRDSTGQPVAQDVVVVGALQEEPSSFR